jgi:hypothetical protein
MNMKKKLLAAVVLCSLGFVGCGGDTETPTPTVPKFDTVENIKTHLDGKKLLMEGASIPTHPNGFDEDVNYGASTQCYQTVQITSSGDKFFVHSTLATLKDAPKTLDHGTCDHATVSGTQDFESTSILIENPKADASCFDITVSYNGFSQVGRAKLSEDGKTLTMELFFGGQATGNTCASGAVGSSTVTLNKAPFTGNAQQVYTVTAQ